MVPPNHQRKKNEKCIICCLCNAERAVPHQQNMHQRMLKKKDIING